MERKIRQHFNFSFLVFFICHSMKFIPNIWELKEAGKENIEWPPFIGKSFHGVFIFFKLILYIYIILEFATSISKLLLTINGSLSVYIYFYKHLDFVSNICFSSQISDREIHALIFRRRSMTMFSRILVAHKNLHVTSSL